MPNNIVFNNVASQLRTQIYGDNGGETKAIATDENGKVSISAQNLDIRDLAADTDSVTVTATDLDIRDLAADTDSVTVTATDLDIRNLTGANDSVIKAGCYFTESSTTISDVSDTGIAMTVNNSDQDVYSFYVNNTGTASISVKLQVAPTDDDSYYMDDDSPEVSVGAGEKAILVAQKFLKFTRLYYNPSDISSIEAYYNAHA